MRLEVFEASDKEGLEICLDLRHKIFVIEKNVPQSIENDEFDVLGGTCRHFYIECDKVPVGAARCNESIAGEIKLQRFCVLDAYRGKGVGRYLMEYIEDFYRRHDVTKIQLDAKFHIHRFYEKCGYTKASEIFMEAGMEHVKMVKEI